MAEEKFSQSNDNKRHLHRVSCHNVVVISLAGNRKWRAHAKDISLKGAFIYEHDEDVTVGEEVVFDIVLSETDDSLNIHGKAKVVRKESGKGIAVHFVFMDVEDLGRLRQFLSLNSGDPDAIDDDLKGLIEHEI